MTRVYGPRTSTQVGPTLRAIMVFLSSATGRGRAWSMRLIAAQHFRSPLRDWSGGGR